MDLDKQIERVKMLTEMAEESINKYVESEEKYKNWKESEDKDWHNYPYQMPKSEVKDRMKLLRQEMIKLDKML